MASGINVRSVIETVLSQYARIPYAHGELQCEPVFDAERGRYMLVTVGWDRDQRVHSTLVHIDLVGEKVWIQRDGTEHGIANELVAAGVPAEQIVLGFRSPEVRQFTGFAAA